VATNTKDKIKFESYTFHAKALAAHFCFKDDGNRDFGPQYALSFHGRSPFKHKDRTGNHKHPEISFTHSWVHITAKEGRGGVYTAISKASLRNLNVKGKVTADEIIAGIMAVYREEWFYDPDRPKRPRILPLTPVFKNLRVCGQPYRLGKELQLPAPFTFSDARRKAYFEGEGPEIEPVDVCNTPGKREKFGCCEVEISPDTRRIESPDFGTVTFAEWKWLPAERHTYDRTVQWVQLVGLDLANPGSGGGGGVGGGGSPSFSSGGSH